MTTFNQFVSTIKTNGIARSSTFFCNILPPPFMIQTASPDVQNIIPFYVDNVNMPEMTLSTQSVKDAGLNREVVIDKNYGTCTFGFHSDANMTVKMFFDNWLQAVVKDKGGVFMYPESYTAETLTIYQLDPSKQVTYVVNMNNVYPKIVDDANLQANSRDLLSFRVQFVYESWDSFQIDMTDTKAPITKDNSDNIKRAWSFIQLIRTGANKDAIKSSIINLGTRKIYDLLGKTGTDKRVARGIDDILGKTGIGGALESIERIIQ